MATTWLRSAGSATNGVANDDASAHEYIVAADWSHRPAAHSSPPLPFSHSTWSVARNTVASAGVL